MRVRGFLSARSFPATLAAVVLWVGSAVSTDWARLAAAQPAGETSSGRVEVAKCVTPTGSIWRREAEGKPWEAVKQGGALYSGDLLLGLAGATLEARNGAVRLAFPSNLSGTAPLPILESAVTLRDSKEADLEFALDRGRVDVTNHKAQGEARVRMHIQHRERAGEAVLSKPGTQIALMLFGRWHAGVPFTKTPKPGDAPILHLIFLVLRGEVDLKVETRHVALTAPPGPALIQWDSVTGADLRADHLDQVPAWAEDSTRSEVAKEKLAALEQFRQLALNKSLPAALNEMVQSEDPVQRRLAVFIMGALDDLPQLGPAVAATKYRDVWENAVLALRHWIGRGPGQDLKLYNSLIKDRNYTEVDAHTVLQLLHDFGEEQLARPELYDTLIDYLEHEKLGVRGLAYWHLSRLVPEGRSIGYDPLASKESRQKAAAQWHKLIPSGQLPPKRKAGT
jgi:hypothetical protein